MTTLIFVENVLGSGQLVTLKEVYGDHSVIRDLRPGEHARLVVSPFKSISIEEGPLPMCSASQRSERSALTDSPPVAVQRRHG